MSTECDICRIKCWFC